MTASVDALCRWCSSVFPAGLYEPGQNPLPEPPATTAQKPCLARWPGPAWQNGAGTAKEAVVVCGGECSRAQNKCDSACTEPAPPAPKPDVRDEPDRKSRQIVRYS